MAKRIFTVESKIWFDGEWVLREVIVARLGLSRNNLGMEREPEEKKTRVMRNANVIARKAQHLLLAGRLQREMVWVKEEGAGAGDENSIEESQEMASVKDQARSTQPSLVLQTL